MSDLQIDVFWGVMQSNSEDFSDIPFVVDNPARMQCFWSISSMVRYAETSHHEPWTVFIWGSMREIDLDGKVVHADDLIMELDSGKDLNHLLKRKEGEFFVAVWDAKNRVGYLASDPLGHIKVYYKKKKNSLEFSSHPLLLSRFERRDQISKEGLELLLSLRVIPSPYTILRDVYKISPGQIMTFRGDNLYFDDYYSPYVQDNFVNNLSLLDASSCLIKNLGNVIARSTSDLGQISGLFLSGGVDSGLLLAMLDQLGSPVENYTVSYLEKYANNESATAKRTAETFHSRISIINEQPGEILELIQQTSHLLPEPVGDISFYPQLFLGRKASERVKVVFDGTGADNLFGGLNKSKAETYIKNYLIIPGVFRKELIPNLVNKLPTSRKSNYSGLIRKAQRFIEGSNLDYVNRQIYWTRLLHHNVIKNIVLSDWQCEDDICASHLMKAYPKLNYERRLTSSSVMSVQGVLPYTSLYKINMIESLTGLSIRMPYLAPDFVQFALGLPDWLKVNGHQTKLVLRKAAEIYFYPKLRKRHPGNFTPPMRLWVRGQMKEFFCSEILNDGPFDLDFVSAMIDDQLSDRCDWLLELWVIFMFQLWNKTAVRYQTFQWLIDNRTRSSSVAKGN